MADLLGTIAGGAIGFMAGGPAGAMAGAQLGSNIDANQSRADIASAANAFSAQQYATRYQTTVKDLEAAGLSPMLAYSQGPGAAPSAQQAAVGNSMEGVNQAYVQAKAVSAELAKKEAEVANIQADTNNKSKAGELMDAQASAARASAWESSSRQELQSKQSAEIQQRLERDLPGKQAEEIMARINSLYADYALKIKQGLTEDMRKFQVEYAAGKLSKEIQSLDLGMPEREALSKFFSSDIGKNSPMARFVMEMGQDVSNLILPWKKFGLSQKGRWSETTRSDNSGNVSTTTTQSGIE